MRMASEQVVESTITKGVSVIRAAGRPKKSVKMPEVSGFAKGNWHPAAARIY